MFEIGDAFGGIAKFFARGDKSTVKVDVKNPESAIFHEEAVSALVKYITRFPDQDEVLRKAGIRRDRLRVLLYDDEIAQACETRLDALLATPLRIEPTDSKQSQQLNDLLQDFWLVAKSGAWQARLFGYSVLEAVYERRADGLIGLNYLGEKPMQWFEPRQDGRLMFFADNGNNGTTGLGVEVDQRYKFFLTTCRATYSQPFGESLLSRLYWPWYFRNNGWKFWAKFLERFGSPLLVGKSTDPKAMVAALLSAHSQAVMGIDREDSVDAVSLPSGNSGQAFEAFETNLVRRIQKVILGQTLTSGTDGGSGNRALGQVHDNVRTDKRNSDIQLIQPTLQKIVDALCDLNGFDRHEVVFTDEVGLEAARATRDKDLYAVGVRFSQGYFEDNYDLKAEDFAGLIQPDRAAAAGDGTQLSRGGAAAGAKQFERQIFDGEQSVLEQQADAALATAGPVLDQEQMRAAIMAATGPEDLAERLFALIGARVSSDEFQGALERALYASDVLGFVAATKDDAQ
jgi:phage gp29-like protein